MISEFTDADIARIALDNRRIIEKLVLYGILSVSKDGSDVRAHNIGNSDYAQHIIQPWAIWLDYPALTAWDKDIVKRILRKKDGDPRRLDYEKIIHICKERIRQIDLGLE